MLVREERGGSRKLPLTDFLNFFLIFFGRQKHAICDKSFFPHPDFCTLFYLSCTGGTNYINRLVLNYLFSSVLLCNFCKYFDVYCRSSCSSVSVISICNLEFGPDKLYPFLLWF